MSLDRQKRADDYVAHRRLLVQERDSQMGVAMLALLRADIESYRDKLETCAVEDFQKLQGAVKSARQMITYITQADLAPRTT